MDLLYDDINIHIISFIEDFEYLYNIILINKYFLNITLGTFKNSIMKYNKLIDNKYPIFIRRLFKNIAQMREIQDLEFKDRYMGPTGSIDRITLTDIDYPMMYGIDNRNNGFLVLKLKIKMQNNESSYRYRTTIISIFQKPNIYYRWCIASDEPYYTLLFNSIILNHDIMNLKKIINGDGLNYYYCEVNI